MTQKGPTMNQAVEQIDTRDAERADIIAHLDRMKVEASENGAADAVFWIVQIKRDIASLAHLQEQGS